MTIQAKTALHCKTFKSPYSDTKKYCHVAMSDVAWRAFLKNHYHYEYRADLGGFHFTARSLGGK